MRFRLFALTVAAALAPLALAQSFTPVREQKNLTPEALAKLHTLETLNALPAGEWRFHAGDVPHGESADLDDSKWTLVKPRGAGSNGKAPKDAVWYRRTIEVPKTLNGYDLSGARIWFQFVADANGAVPEIIYFNGRRVALGEDLEPVIMFDPAKPGDKIVVAVKLLHTVDEKTFTGVRMKIDVTAGRPSPDDIRVQCLTAANLLPALAKPRKDLLPTVEKAVADIDATALQNANQSAFDASLRKAQDDLKPLHDVLRQADIVMAGNAHIDAAWLWPKSETIDVVRRTFTTALQLMDEYPDYTFSQSAAQYSEWMADKYPAMNAEIKKRIQEGRWEIVGGMWVEPDLNLPGGESLVRQLLVGQRYFQKEYGVTARIGWNPDSFGYNWQLPQIYKRSGLDYFVTQKMHWNDTNQLPFRLFWWESPDGSKVLTYFPTDYVHLNVNPTRLSADFAESAQRNPGTTEDLDLYGVGDHGGGPTRAMLDEGDHWIAAGKAGEAVPTMRYGTAQSYFNDVEKKLNPNSPTWNYDKIAQGWTAPAAGAHGEMGVPTWKDELYFEYHRGIMTTQAQHKRYMRTSEQETLDTEKLASLAWVTDMMSPNWLHKASYPDAEITENWKKITFNQFHDLAAGSGIAVIYRDAAKEFTEVAHSDELINKAALGEIEPRINTQAAGAIPVLLFNTSPWSRSGTVEVTVQTPERGHDVSVTDASGKELIAQHLGRGTSTGEERLLVRVPEVPALGYEVLQAHESQRTDSTKSDLAVTQSASSISLHNEKLQVVVDRKTGCITSIKSAQAGTQFIAPNGCANELQAYKDTPKQYDAWNVDPGTFDVPSTKIDQVDSVELVVDGPLRKTISVTRHWQKSKFVQEISLDAGSDQIDVANDFDWHETHVLLKAAFPLAATSAKATYEIPFGTIERPTTQNNTWEKAKFEVPALRWADLGDDKQGVSILNDSKYGYDALGNTLRLTLLRSPTWPDEDADRGPQHFTYAIYPHAGTWKQAETVKRGYELNDPLHAEQVFAHTGELPASYSFASVENKNVTLTAMKKAEDADALVFRMYEWAGTPSEVKLHVPKGASYAVESNLMEKVEGKHLPLASDVVTVPIKPYEILTVQVFYPKH